MGAAAAAALFLLSLSLSLLFPYRFKSRWYTAAGAAADGLFLSSPKRDVSFIDLGGGGLLCQW